MVAGVKGRRRRRAKRACPRRRRSRAIARAVCWYCIGIVVVGEFAVAGRYDGVLSDWSKMRCTGPGRGGAAPKKCVPIERPRTKVCGEGTALATHAIHSIYPPPLYSPAALPLILFLARHRSAFGPVLGSPPPRLGLAVRVHDPPRPRATPRSSGRWSRASRPCTPSARRKVRRVHIP